MNTQSENPPALICSLTSQIILGMILGVVVGLIGGLHLAPLAVFGTLLIQIIKAVAVPLIFLAILEAVISTDITWKGGRRLLLIVMANSICAASIALMLTNLIEPGRNLDFIGQFKNLSLENAPAFVPQKLNPLEIISGHIPTSLLQPFLNNDVVGIVLIALLIGVAVRQTARSNSNRESLIHPLLLPTLKFFITLFEKILYWLVRLTPLAVFGVTAKTVGEHGFAPFKGLSFYVLTGILGLILQIVFVYQTWIKFYAGKSLKIFWHEAKEALVYAAGTNSSLATLPLTLKTLDRLNISKASSRLGACIGTNLNNDGIILYEAMAVLFVAQAYGINLTFTEQFSTILLCIFAAIGVAGVPEAGIISLSLVLAAVNLPLEILPLLLTVDWVIARARSITNVLADMTVSIALDVMDDGRPAL